MFPQSRKDLYETKDPDSAESLERMTKRFSSDLRAQVKKIQCPQIFSKEWLFMTTTLEHVSKIAGIENKPRPSSTSTPPTPAKNNSKSSFSSILLHSSSMSPSKNDPSHQTLWEKEEFCVRYMVEEGKVNVLLRLIIDFKSIQYKIFRGEIRLEDQATKLSMDSHSLSSKLVKFEDSVGQLLKCCFCSVEALQTLDLQQLFEYIASVLTFSCSDQFKPPSNPNDYNRVQEYMIFIYMDLVFRQIDNLQEEAIGKMVLDRQLIPKMIYFLEKYGGDFTEQSQFIASSALASFMDTEFFQTHKEKFLPGDEEKSNLVKLKSKYVSRLLTNYQRKKALRPLMDMIMQLEISNPNTNIETSSTTTTTASSPTTTSSNTSNMKSTRSTLDSLLGRNTGTSRSEMLRRAGLF